MCNHLICAHISQSRAVCSSTLINILTYADNTTFSNGTLDVVDSTDRPPKYPCQSPLMIGSQYCDADVVSHKNKQRNNRHTINLYLEEYDKLVMSTGPSESMIGDDKNCHGKLALSFVIRPLSFHTNQ